MAVPNSLEQDVLIMLSDICEQFHRYLDQDSRYRRYNIEQRNNLYCMAQAYINNAFQQTYTTLNATQQSRENWRAPRPLNISAKEAIERIRDNHPMREPPLTEDVTDAEYFSE